MPEPSSHIPIHRSEPNLIGPLVHVLPTVSQKLVVYHNPRHPGRHTHRLQNCSSQIPEAPSAKCMDRQIIIRIRPVQQLPDIQTDHIQGDSAKGATRTAAAPAKSVGCSLPASVRTDHNYPYIGQRGCISNNPPEKTTEETPQQWQARTSAQQTPSQIQPETAPEQPHQHQQTNSPE